ncbi:hypothetical protein ACVWZN_001609 [Lysobacter sp. HA35]
MYRTALTVLFLLAVIVGASSLGVAFALDPLVQWATTHCQAGCSTLCHAAGIAVTWWWLTLIVASLVGAVAVTGRGFSRVAA